MATLPIPLGGLVLSSPALAAPALPEIPAPWHSIPDIGPLLKQDRVLGPAQAEISIVVWSDPECPYCKQFSGVPDAAVARANSGGTARANFALRLLPLPFHGAAAVVGALGALCVAAGWPGRLLQVPGRLFRTHRRQWPGPSVQRRQRKNDSAKNDSGRAAVSDLAVKDGASDKGKLEACLRSDDTLGRIAAEGDSAEAADVEGTPAVALRNNLTGETILVNGAIDPDTLDQGIALMARRGLRHAAPPPDYAR
jgi:protein-disulfide isomerase